MGNACTAICDCSGVNRNRPTDQYVKTIMRDYPNGRPFVKILDERLKYFEKFSKTDIKKLFEFKDVLGSGHFGSVYSAVSLYDQTRWFAIKAIDKSRISERSLKRLEQEFEILRTIDHPNVVKYYGTFTDRRFIYIVLEQCKGGEVFEKIQSLGTLSESMTAKVAHQTL